MLTPRQFSLLAAFVAVTAAGFAIFSCGKTADEKPSTGFETASVTRITGLVRLERSGKTSSLSDVGTKLVTGDILHTGPSARLDFEIEGRGIIQVGPESDFVFRDLKGAKSADLRLDKGRALLVLKKLQPSDSFNVSTPAAIAGVRGTSFQLSANGEGAGIAVLTGRVEFKGASGQVVFVDAKKESTALGKDLSQASAIRGSRLAEVKELLGLPGVEKMADFEAMKANLKLLELDDEKSTSEEMRLKGDMRGQGATGGRKDMSESLTEAERAKVKKKADQFSSDRDMMLK